MRSVVVVAYTIAAYVKADAVHPCQCDVTVQQKPMVVAGEASSLQFFLCQFFFSRLFF